MSTYGPAYDAEEPDWDEVMNDPAVTAVTRYAPPNSAAQHTEDSDRRILENMRSQAPWMQRIVAGVVAELNNGGI